MEKIIKEFMETHKLSLKEMQENYSIHEKKPRYHPILDIFTQKTTIVLNQ